MHYPTIPHDLSVALVHVELNSTNTLKYLQASQNLDMSVGRLVNKILEAVELAAMKEVVNITLRPTKEKLDAVVT